MTYVNLRAWLGDLELTSYPFGLEFGMDLGRPENVYTVMESLLADGEVVTSNRTSNRSLALPVLIEGTDMQALADHEAVLIAECERPRNLLTIDPGDGFGPATVFEVFRAQARHIRSDDEEIGFVRRFALEIQSLPAARAPDRVTFGSSYSSEAVTVSDDCESTTGWSFASSPSRSFSVDSTSGNRVSGTGAVKTTLPVTSTGSWMQTRARIRKTLSISGASGGYLVMAVRYQWGNSINTSSEVANARITTTASGTVPVQTVVAGALSNGYVRVAWALPDASTITAIEFDVSQGTAHPGPEPVVWFDQIGVSPAVSLGRQATRYFEVAGSMRTEGSLAVSAATGLGDVLVYTCPDNGQGFRPDMRRWFVSGSASTNLDTGALNGSYINLSTGYTLGSSPRFEPTTAMFLAGGGTHQVLARLRRNPDNPSMPVVVKVQAQTVIGGVVVGPTYELVSPDLTPTMPAGETSFYYVATLGTLDLPPTPVAAGANASVRLSVAAGSAGSVRLDELMVFPLDDAALTVVPCGNGATSATVASRVWIDEPTPQQPRGGVFVGNDANRLDARRALPTARGRHLLYPGRMLVYVQTAAGAGADFEGSYYPRAHTNNAHRGS